MHHAIKCPNYTVDNEQHIMTSIFPNRKLVSSQMLILKKREVHCSKA